MSSAMARITILMLACFHVFHGLPTESVERQEDNVNEDPPSLFRLLDTKIRLLEQRLEIDLNILRVGNRRNNGESCATCGPGLASLALEIRKLQLDIKQMWVGHRMQGRALHEYIVNQTKPLSDQLHAIMAVVHTTSTELSAIRKQMAFLSAKIGSVAPDTVISNVAVDKPVSQNVTVISNVVVDKPVSQSSTYEDAGTVGHAWKANDGSNRQNHYDICAHTQVRDKFPWWTVDLESVHRISMVKVYNRADCCGSRLRNFSVDVSDTKLTEVNAPGSIRCGHYPGIAVEGEIIEFRCPPDTLGRWLKVQIQDPVGSLSLCEVEVFGVDAA